MASDLTFRPFWPAPAFRSLLDEDDFFSSQGASGLSISEDDRYVYIQAAVPGVDPKDIEVTFDKGVVWIKGEGKDEEKKKKVYRKMTSSFSYRVVVPGELDQAKEPEATYRNGVMTVAFAKIPESQPKKITVKAA